MTARWIGAAPRQRGSSEPCRLKQPSRGASRIGFGQHQAVGDDDRGIEIQRGERCLLRSASFSDTGVRTGNPCVAASCVDRRRFGRQAAALGTRRLGIDGGDVVALRDQLGKSGHREIRRAHESEAQGSPCLFQRSLPCCSLRNAMERLSRERWSMNSTPFR